jgi:SAM-dependent methyltransferase
VSPEPVDLFDSTYQHFTTRVLKEIRKDTFGHDIGQNSWITADEFDRFLSWLGVAAGDHILEVASGSGGPALHAARTLGCRVTGIDANASAVSTASALAEASADSHGVRFLEADATAVLPFDADCYDGLVCIDSMNHFPERGAVFKEWHRVLRTGRRAVFTDPVVVTGPVTNEELALRSSIGLFLFVPPGTTESLLEQAGFKLSRREDVSAGAAAVARRWHDARQARREALLGIEGEERFTGLQRFFDSVARLTGERRLSRVVYVAEKAGW